MLLMLPLTQLSSRVVNTYSCLISLHLPLPQQAGHLPGGLTEAGSCLLSVEFLLVYNSSCKCQVAAQPPFTMISEHSLFHQGGRLVTTPLTGEFLVHKGEGTDTTATFIFSETSTNRFFGPLLPPGQLPLSLGLPSKVMPPSSCTACLQK